jgi:DNA mismatch endonuclease (patch repair protein)
MAAVRAKDTKPEIAVRAGLWREGLRYRIYDGSVPGRPDISHKGAKVAVFLDGCFWHGCPRHYAVPKTRKAFWSGKVNRNRERRAEVVADLEATGWLVVEHWECRIKETPESVINEIAAILRARRKALPRS